MDLAGTLISGGDAKARTPAPTPQGAEHLPVVDKRTYVVEGTFARGGIGRILRARDVRLGRPVALKELLDPKSPDEGRFVNEALVTARLQHPSIVPIYEAGRWPNGEPFYAMKLVSGRSLDERLDETKSFGERLALLPHVLAVAEAMAYAHSQRIIHRDLKPANVLVGEFGETVVIDWGLAKELSDEAAAPAPVEPPSAVPFNPDSATPSFSRGAARPHAWRGSCWGRRRTCLRSRPRAAPWTSARMSTRWAPSSITCWPARRPYGSGQSSEVLDQVIAGPPPSLEQLQQGIPEELLAIVAQAMARDQAQRYPTARELAEDLRRFLTGQIVGAHDYSRRICLMRFVRRNRAVVGGGGHRAGGAGDGGCAQRAAHRGGEGSGRAQAGRGRGRLPRGDGARRSAHPGGGSRGGGALPQQGARVARHPVLRRSRSGARRESSPRTPRRGGSRCCCAATPRA